MANIYVATTGSDVTGTGIQGNPYATIKRASQAAVAGDVVNVASGTYRAGFQTTVSGTAIAPIRFVSTVKWGAKLVPAVPSDYDFGWECRGGYNYIENFEVDGSGYVSGTKWRFGLYIAGQGSRITGCHVHHIGLTLDPLNNSGGAGIEADGWYGATDLHLIGNIVHDIGPAASNFIHGAYHAATGSIVNNLIYRISGWGIHLWHDANHVNVINNTVFNCISGGVVVGGADFVNTTGPDDYCLVQNNIVYDCAPWGIYEAESTGIHNRYTNNLVYNSGTAYRLQNGLQPTNVISADPQFMNYIRTGGGDYHLGSASPAVNAGANASSPATDLDGVVRPQGVVVDIGAYERVQTSTSPSPLHPYHPRHRHFGRR